ncbi:MAG: acetyl-CoA carboxylase, carboxyltransferase subunit beta [Alphaproteobacteria bacterium]|nr:acetyl-CoA carboxylase, carboxyltransferase subunit beta [Alphaproteobacteria bacterium]
MNWLRRHVRPRLRAVLTRSDRSDGDTLWHTCQGCGQLIFHKEFEENQSVCPQCDHHHRIGPSERFEALFDFAAWEVIDLPKGKDDPLKFRDKKRYSDRLKEARHKTGDHEALISAFGTIENRPAVVAVQNFHFMAGSLSQGAGDGFIVAVQRAVQERAALVVFTAAGGARMQEGILSLMQMPRTTAALDMLQEEGLPYIVVLTDPTTGGVTASYAMLGDIQIAEPGALIGFAGPRVIENTIREQLPQGFQRSEYLLEHGMIDMVVHRAEMKATLGRLLNLLAPYEPSQIEQRDDLFDGDLQPEAQAEAAAPEMPDAPNAEASEVAELAPPDADEAVDKPKS